MTLDPKGLRIVYMGTPDFAVAPLNALVDEGYNVVAVVTMPDKPAGRGLKIQESAVKRYAVQAGLPLLQPDSLKSDAFTAELQRLSPDIGIVVAFRMLPEAIFSIPRYGTFNLHASLLPQYRGAAPINWAIINGESETGVTTFLLNPKMDEGAVIATERVRIDLEDNAGSLHDKLMKTGAGLVTDSIKRIATEGFHASPQAVPAEGGLRPAPKIFKETCRLDFSREGRALVNLIRGVSPVPGAWTDLVERSSGSGDILRTSVLKIYSARFEPDAGVSEPAGSMFIDGSLLKIACRDGYIIPEQLQPAGKQRMDTRDYLNGLKTRGELGCV